MSLRSFQSRKAVALDTGRKSVGCVSPEELPVLSIRDQARGDRLTILRFYIEMDQFWYDTWGATGGHVHLYEIRHLEELDAGLDKSVEDIPYEILGNVFPTASQPPDV